MKNYGVKALMLILAAMLANVVLASSPYPPVTDGYRLSSNFVTLETDTGRLMSVVIEPQGKYYGRPFDTVLLGDMREDCAQVMGEDCEVIFFAPILTPRP